MRYSTAYGGKVTTWILPRPPSGPEWHLIEWMPAAARLDRLLPFQQRGACVCLPLPAAPAS